MIRWLAFLLLALPSAAMAMESTPVTSPRVVATLVSAQDAVAPGQALRLGLRLRMQPGWHTYWRNPGDAGVATELALDLPPGAKAGPLAWPGPERIPEGPVMAYGYTNEVLLPLEVTPGPAAGPLSIVAHGNWLVCQNICVPEEGSFTLTLPAGVPAPSAQAPLFAATDLRLPRPSPFQASIAPDGTLSVPGLPRVAAVDAYFFADTFGTVQHAAPQTAHFDAEGLRLALQPGPQFRPDAVLSGVLALRDRSDQLSFLALQAPPGPALQAGGGEGWAHVLLLAFLGGLVLNAMPCVFPVLAIKAVQLARMSGAARGAIRAQAASYTMGVLASFLLLAGVLLGLRATGAAVGWGFQFQSPAFVAAGALLMFAVGLNLSGVFQVGGSAAGAGQGLAGRGGHAGSFFTGLLAVLVATPCTAPFMAPALAAALAAPIPQAVAVFLAMGLGLAAPYALLGLVPAAARLLPRPGAWMETLRQALAFPMYAAAAWLVWVLSQQAGPTGVLAVSAGLVLLGFAGWALGRAQASTRSAPRRVARVCAALAALAAIAVLPALVTAAVPQGTVQGAGEDEAFTPGRLAALRAEGRPVFVNMTAAWCVTCLVNERLALAPARQAFADRHVATLKGDWTRGDHEITAYLRAHARDGVPLYVFYPPGGEGRVLPQILTQATLLEAVGG